MWATADRKRSTIIMMLSTVRRIMTHALPEFVLPKLADHFIFSINFNSSLISSEASGRILHKPGNNSV